MKIPPKSWNCIKRVEYVDDGIDLFQSFEAAVMFHGFEKRYFGGGHVLIDLSVLFHESLTRKARCGSSSGTTQGEASMNDPGKTDICKALKFFYAITFSLVLILSSTGAEAEFFKDIIVTSPEGMWTDAREYTSLSAALASVGTAERTIVIASQQTVTSLTVPSNVKFKFERNGAIVNSGKFTGHSNCIIAENRQIFTGPGQVLGLGLSRPEWFGLSTSATASVNTSALNKALIAGTYIKIDTTGTVNVNGTVTVANNNTVVEGNANLKIAQTRYVAAYSTVSFYATGKNNLKFKNLHIYGEGTYKWPGSSGVGDWGIYVVGCTGIEISECWIQNCSYVGIRSTRSTGINIHNNTIEGTNSVVPIVDDNRLPYPNTVYANHQYGIAVDGTSAIRSTNVRILDNDISGVVQGIVSSYCEEMVVSGNNIHNIKGQHGMYLGSSNLAVTGNVVRSTRLMGIKFQTTTPNYENINISDNVIEDTGAYGISVSSIGTGLLSNVTIGNNTLHNTGEGILSNASRLSIIRNKIDTTTADAGIDVRGGAGIIIDHNILSSIATVGIRIYSGTWSDAKISSNVVRNANTLKKATTASSEGIYLAGTGSNCQVENNNVSDSDRNQLYAFHVNALIPRLRVIGNTFSGAKVNSHDVYLEKHVDEWIGNSYNKIKGIGY